MKGLIIKDPWISKILAGEKTWEIRGSNTKIRGTISLIKSGTGMIYGTVELVDSRKVNYWEMDIFFQEHQIPHAHDIPYDNPYAWVLREPTRYAEPIPYKHPQGAVIWVNLDKAVFT